MKTWKAPASIFPSNFNCITLVVPLMKCILQELRRLSMLCQVAKVWRNPLPPKKHYRYMLGQRGMCAGSRSLLFWWHDEKSFPINDVLQTPAWRIPEENQTTILSKALVAQCVPCSCELQLHRCHINSICQVVGADKNTNDCQKQAPRLLLSSFLFPF